MNNGIYIDPCNCACYYQCGGGMTEFHESCTNTNTLFSPINFRCDDDFTVSCPQGTPACDLNGDNCIDHTGPQYTPPPKVYCSSETADKCTYFGEYVEDEGLCDPMRCFCENVPPTTAIESPCSPGTVWCVLAGTTDIWGCTPIQGCNTVCYP